MTGAHSTPHNRYTLTLIVGAAAVLLAAGLIIASKAGQSTSSSSKPPAVTTASASASSRGPKMVSLRPTASKSTANTEVAATTKSIASKAATGPLTYIVKPGDTLFTIAAWFHQHGYGGLYEKNKAVLGGDPDLIRPGQRITLSATGMVAH